MMNNLFSVFDPSTSIMSFSWVILFLSLSVMIPKMWKVSSPFTNMMKKVVFTLKKEVSFTLNKKEKGSEAMILLTFTAIILMNFVALYPQVFSLTSHLTVTLPISLILWTSLMLFGWTKNTNHVLAHLVPQGTPKPLMMFMVMIELTSNIIRPITLCVRLTANLIAGHLLMSLLGNSLINLSIWMIPMGAMVPVILTILESAVACIQAYVFMTLVTLYLTELKYWKKNLIHFI